MREILDVCSQTIYANSLILIQSNTPCIFLGRSDDYVLSSRILMTACSSLPASMSGTANKSSRALNPPPLISWTTRASSPAAVEGRRRQKLS